MRFSYTTLPFESHPEPVEIAELAFKFYKDSNCQNGHDQENWLCAEYMLTQKEYIRKQIESIHRRGR